MARKEVDLTTAEQRNLAPVKEKFETSGERMYEAPAFIDEKTCNHLREVLNMKQDTRRYVEQEEDPYFRAIKVAEDYLDSFSQDADTTGTKSMFHQIGSWSETTFPPQNYVNYAIIHDAAAVGISLVVKAFRTQLGQEFMDNLRKTDPREVMIAFDSRGKLVTHASSLVERARARVKIPEDQVFLKGFIKEFTDFYAGNASPHVESGAAVAFSVIGKLWPKLKPGAHNSAVSPTN